MRTSVCRVKQTARDALLQEVSYLSAKNSELEEKLRTAPKMSEDMAELRRNNEVLLTLLGEGEEGWETVAPRPNWPLTY